MIKLIIYIAVTAVPAVTTFLSPTVYGSWWFIALWGAFALVLLLSICTTRMWRNAGRFIFHLSFLAMLGGGLLTYLTKVDGHIRIEPGQTVSSFIDRKGTKHDLPHAIKLDKFEIVYYPGGIVPRDYVSHIEIDGVKATVSMNHIFNLNGFHLLQLSYDDSGATVLSINHDPYGLYLSYAGYLMFAIGGLMLLLSKKGRFRRLLRRVSAAAGLLLAFGFNASASTIDGVPLEHADSLKSQQVIYNGRTVTFNTLSRDILLKIYGKATYRGLTSEQTLLSLKLFPDKWKYEPLIKIKEKTVSDVLGINGKYASLSDLFDTDGNYKVDKLYVTLGSENRRAVEDLDEKVGIILTLFSGELIVIRPDNVEPLSDTHIKIELLYNSIPFTKIIFMILMTGFVIGMVLYLVSLSLKKKIRLHPKTAIHSACVRNHILHCGFCHGVVSVRTTSSCQYFRDSAVCCFDNRIAIAFDRMPQQTADEPWIANGRSSGTCDASCRIESGCHSVNAGTSFRMVVAPRVARHDLLRHTRFHLHHRSSRTYGAFLG